MFSDYHIRQYVKGEILGHSRSLTSDFVWQLSEVLKVSSLGVPVQKVVNADSRSSPKTEHNLVERLNGLNMEIENIVANQIYIKAREGRKWKYNGN